MYIAFIGNCLNSQLTAAMCAEVNPSLQSLAGKDTSLRVGGAKPAGNEKKL
jgi:hypothetical protein